MIHLTLVDGKKGPGDVLVLVDADHEPLSFSDWLYIGLWYAHSEDSYYPRASGYKGSEYLMMALDDLVYNGLPIETVLAKYQLENKLNITDNRQPSANLAQGKKDMKLEEILA